jgi:formyltetrahydrofolate synthetase
LELVRKLTLEAGAYAAVVANHWAQGGSGAVDLGNAVIEACAFAKSSSADSFKLVNCLLYIVYILLFIVNNNK